MKEVLISFKTAKLAESKKLNIKEVFGRFIDKNWYTRSGVLNGYTPKEPFYACSQTSLQKLLLEKHGYFVTVELAYNEWGRYSANVQKKAKDGVTAIIALDGFTIFNNPEDALEEGLFETLKLIKYEA